jgi:hypothetical protein
VEKSKKDLSCNRWNYLSCSSNTKAGHRLLSSALRVINLTLCHHTVEVWVTMVLTSTVYIQCTTIDLSPQVLPNVPLLVEKDL